MSTTNRFNVTLTNYARGLSQDLKSTLADFLAPDRAGLDTLTNEVAQRLASGGPKALAATKALLNRLDGSEDRDAVLRGAELSASVLATPEAQAALKARMVR
jgi:enoyl-CoA hydratase/carnithine racemase